MNKIIASAVLLGSLVSFQSLAAFTEEVKYKAVEGVAHETKESAFAQGKELMAEISEMSSNELKSEFGRYQFDSMARDYKLIDLDTQVKESMNAEGEIEFTPVTNVKYSYMHNDR